MTSFFGNKERKEPLIIAIGGGKGGVGKSMVSSNLAVHYSQAGFRVVLVDLDVGAANLHTIFGIRQPSKGLGDFFTTPRSILSNYLVETKVNNLSLAPGSGFVPELANIRYAQKVKIINQIKTLDADIVLLDLGAGSSSNVVDFFSMTQTGIVVTTPEPTAVVNAYEFLKNVVFRILFRMFRNQDKIIDKLKAASLPNQEQSGAVPQLIDNIREEYPWAAETIQEVCDDLSFYVVFNQSRKLTDVQLGKKLHDICLKYLGIKLNYSGILFFNEEVSSSVYKMCPISMAYPDSVTSHMLHRLANRLIHQVSSRVYGSGETEPFELQYERICYEASRDFQQNYLTQKRLNREREQEEMNVN